MRTIDFMSERERQDLRDAGRGHLLGEYRSPLDVADEARKRSKEEPQMNTDKAEVLGKPVEASNNAGVTTGVHGAATQGVDGRRMDEAMTGVADPVQNTGDDDFTADDQGDDSANEGEQGPADPFES